MAIPITRACLKTLVICLLLSTGLIRNTLAGSPPPTETNHASGDQAPAVREHITGYVARVLDGDSLILNTKHREIEVRLHGIDAPEWKQPFAEQSKAKLKQLALARRAVLHKVTTDSYGRSVGVIYIGTTNINLQMVSEGYAWWYRKYAPQDKTLIRAETEARKNRKGLWEAAAPIPPWQWRKTVRQKN